jgi:antirestriction protein ArdC
LALPLRANGIAYRGVNILVLWAAAQQQGYTSPHWFSFKQARELGGSVRRGERATHVVYYSGARQQEPDESQTAEETPKRRSFLRTFAVFNACQIDALPGRFHFRPDLLAEPDDAALARLFARVPATVRYGGARACYDPMSDTIQMPPRTAFASTALHYATLAHELGHWTGHASRLDRDLSQPRTSASYAGEELVAELTAAFLGAELGLPVDHVEQHASYIESWIRLLAGEPGALMSAAGKAQAAADLLRGYMLSSTTAEDA